MSQFYGKMCELNVYLSGEEETLILQDINFFEVKDGKVLIRNILGEEKTVDCKIKSLSMREHKLVLTDDSSAVCDLSKKPTESASDKSKESG